MASSLALLGRETTLLCVPIVPTFLEASCLRQIVQRLAVLLGRLLPRAPIGSTPETLTSPSDKLDCLIILDRCVDMITPLLTQLTYEGLIDEVIGIKNCTFLMT